MAELRDAPVDCGGTRTGSAAFNLGIDVVATVGRGPYFLAAKQDRDAPLLLRGARRRVSGPVDVAGTSPPPEQPQVLARRRRVVPPGRADGFIRERSHGAAAELSRAGGAVFVGSDAQQLQDAPRRPRGADAVRNVGVSGEHSTETAVDAPASARAHGVGRVRQRPHAPLRLSEFAGSRADSNARRSGLGLSNGAQVPTVLLLQHADGPRPEGAARGVATRQGGEGRQVETRQKSTRPRAGREGPRRRLEVKDEYHLVQPPQGRAGAARRGRVGRRVVRRRRRHGLHVSRQRRPRVQDSVVVRQAGVPPKPHGAQNRSESTERPPAVPRPAQGTEAVSMPRQLHPVVGRQHGRAAEVDEFRLRDQRTFGAAAVVRAPHEADVFIVTVEPLREAASAHRQADGLETPDVGQQRLGDVTVRSRLPDDAGGAPGLQQPVGGPAVPAAARPSFVARPFTRARPSDAV